MCGIAGFMGHPRGDDVHSVLSKMAKRLMHRGPDDEGIWYNAASGVGLAHRRLAILDLSPEGHQPMFSPSRRYTIVFNGEIYNFKELRTQLEARGARFRGHSDTEVLLAAVEQWGVHGALKRSIGMFAIALFDGAEQTLYLARDRLGKKPLYIATTPRAVIFASELKALRAHPDFEARISRDALAAYFRHNYVPGPHSIYEGVTKLPPAAVLEIRAVGDHFELKESTYWSAREAFDTAQRESSKPNELQQSVNGLEELLQDAVRIRMHSDVPLGAFLSGGIDSTLVVALMAKQSSQPIRTFTMGFREIGFDEAAYARPIAEHFGTQHTEFVVTPEDARAVIPRLPQIYDEPFADSSQIPTLLVSQLARTQVTVALSGDGGDEFFLGYSRYPAARLAWNRIKWLPRSSRARIARFIHNASPTTLNRWLGWMQPLIPKFGRQRTFADAIKKASQLLACADEREFYRAFVSHEKNPSQFVLGSVESESRLSNGSAWLQGVPFELAMGFADSVTYLPDDVLVKVDRASMAVGLEVRAPLLDHRVVEFAWGLPIGQKLVGGNGKILLKQLLRKYVPHELVDRPKTGFGVPIKDWLRGPLRQWVEDTLTYERLSRDGYVDPVRARRLVEEHMTGVRDWHARIWDLMMFCSWLDLARE